MMTIVKFNKYIKIIENYIYTLILTPTYLRYNFDQESLQFY